MKYIQKILPLLSKSSIGATLLLVLSCIYCIVFHDYEGLKRSSMLLFGVVLLYLSARYFISSARIEVGGSTHKNNCPITVIKKIRQGKWKDKNLKFTQKVLRKYLIIFLLLFIGTLTYLVLLWWNPVYLYRIFILNSDLYVLTYFDHL